MNIVITGASKGIGFAVAQAFAMPDSRLFLCSRNSEALQAAVAALKQHPGVSVSGFPADLSQPGPAKAFGQWLLDQDAVPDILLNNAGSFLPGKVIDEPEGTLEAMIGVNLYSAYHLTRAVVPAMIRKGSGHIFNMCSIASLQAYEEGGAYSISKYALYGFSKNLRQELMPHGIKVTHVLPGAVYTDSWKGSGVNPQRIMQAGDIAQLIKAAASLSHQACVEELVIRPLAGDL